MGTHSVSCVNVLDIVTPYHILCFCKNQFFGLRGPQGSRGTQNLKINFLIDLTPNYNYDR